MDAFDKIQSSNFLMMEAFKDFKRMMQKYGNDRGLSEEEEDESELLSRGEDDEVSPLTSVEDDLEQPFQEGEIFNFQEIDAEDPAFYRGVETGLPYQLALVNSHGQGKLLPIVDGLFRGYPGEF